MCFESLELYKSPCMIQILNIFLRAVEIFLILAIIHKLCKYVKYYVFPKCHKCTQKMVIIIVKRICPKEGNNFFENIMFIEM